MGQVGFRYIIDYSLKNGMGNPSVNLYLSGCDKKEKCEGCHNWEMQEENTDDYDMNEIKARLDNHIYNAMQFTNKLYVCVLGGEPLAPYNKKITLGIAKHVKGKYKDVILVLYSWRYLTNIKYFDYGVLGGYDHTQHEDNCIPSSKNQYIYDFKLHKKLPKIYLKKGAI